MIRNFSIVFQQGDLLKTSKIGHKGWKNKVVLARGGMLKKVVGSKNDKEARKSVIEDIMKEQVEVAKLVARDFDQIGFEVKKVDELQLDLSDTGVDVVIPTKTNVEKAQDVTINYGSIEQSLEKCCKVKDKRTTDSKSHVGQDKFQFVLMVLVPLEQGMLNLRELDGLICSKKRNKMLSPPLSTCQ
ncbi:hypothetical protein SLE2022_372330 [Rubroshorea leprosula]